MKQAYASYIVLFSLFITALSFVESAPEIKPVELETKVYVTSSRKTFHFEGCRYLKPQDLDQPMSFSDAIEEYQPCKVCKP